MTRRAVTALCAAATLGCGGGDSGSGPGPVCQVHAVSISPRANLVVGEGELDTLSASLNTSNCPSPPAITWSVTSSRLTLQAAGTSAIITGAHGGDHVRVVASSAGPTTSASDTVQVLVVCSDLTASAIAVGQNVSGQLTTANCEDASDRFEARYRLVLPSAADLRIDLASTAFDASLFLSKDDNTIQAADDDGGPGTDARIVRTLPAGTYHVRVSSSGPAVLGAYMLSVIPYPPAIGLSADTVRALGIKDSTSPPPRTVTVSNTQGGTLSGLGIGTISYGPGATGWLQSATLSSTTAAPTATLTLQVATAGLPAGSYRATIPVQSAAAVNTPKTLHFELVVYVPGPYDGTWVGTNSRGQATQFTVVNSTVTAFSLGIGFPLGSPCYLSYALGANAPIAGGAFSLGATTGTVTGSISGSFSSPTSASGSFGSVTFTDYFCPPNNLVSGTVAGGSWSATKQ